MNTGIELLSRLRKIGYFEQVDFDPRPVFEICRDHLGIDVASSADNERLTGLVNRLVREGLVQFKYSQDPALHPKDILDHWRIFLTPVGLARLDEEKTKTG